jgi:hypothetical protein
LSDWLLAASLDLPPEAVKLSLRLGSSLEVASVDGKQQFAKRCNWRFLGP